MEEIKKRIIKSVGLVFVFLSFVFVQGKENKYEDFLTGKEKAIYLEGQQYSIDELTEEKQGNYVLCDITGDGKAELHLKTKRNYFIIEEMDDSLVVIYDGSEYDNLICNKDVSGILYFREGGAPDNYVYQLYKLGQHGRVEEHEEYSWYDENENHMMDEEDMFLINTSPIGMDEWIKETESFSILLEQSEIQWHEWCVQSKETSNQLLH